MGDQASRAKRRQTMRTDTRERARKDQTVGCNSIPENDRLMLEKAVCCKAFDFDWAGRVKWKGRKTVSDGIVHAGQGQAALGKRVGRAGLHRAKATSMKPAWAARARFLD